MSNNVEKSEIIKSLVASGMTDVQALEAYESAFAPQSGGVKLPFPLIKVNNDATVAPMGALVTDAIKNSDTGDVEGYNGVYSFEDTDVLILDRRATWSKYDGGTARTTVKSELLDTFAKASAYTDSFSGMDIASMKEVDDDIKYQILSLVGIRKRGSGDKFTFFNMYLKGAMLYNFNKLLDTCTGSQYVVLEAITKTSKKGSVKYTEFDLTKSLATPLSSVEVLGSVMEFLDSKTAFNSYVVEYNDSLATVATATEETSAGLPE